MKIVLVALSAMVAGAYSAPALRAGRSLDGSERKCVSSYDFPVQNKSQTPDEWCGLQGGVHCVADTFCPSYCHWDSGPECGADTAAPTPKPTPAPTRAPTHSSVKCDKFENGWTARGNDWENDYVYLDRQNVECKNNGVLRDFHLKTNDNSIKYHYECCTGLADSSAKPIAKTTRWNYEGEEYFHLDRHDVQCPSQSVLSRFQLHRNDDQVKKKIRYEYTCTPANRLLSSCSQTTTESSADGGGSYQYLDRQTPTCSNADEVMTGFRLVRPASNMIAYQVDCCKYEV